MSHDALSGYDAHAINLSDHHEPLDFSRIHGWLLPLLPKTRNSALDVVAGSGREAKGFLHLGYEVVALELSVGSVKFPPGGGEDGWTGVNEGSE